MSDLSKLLGLGIFLVVQFIILCAAYDWALSMAIQFQ